MNQNEKKKLNELGINVDFIIPELFLAYKQRKRINKTLLINDDFCSKLIVYYYRWSESEISFNNMKKSFVTKYCTNESKIEGVNDDDYHGTDEIKGLREMYEFIHSGGIDELIVTKSLGFGQKRNLFVNSPNASFMDGSQLRDAYIASTGTELALIELHAKLYVYSEYPEAAYYMRNDDSYLPGTGTELQTWSEIGPSLKLLDIDVQKLLEDAKEIRKNNNFDGLLEYINSCVKLKCKLIKIHPFPDGNGRTIRAFINKLLEEVGLPPIYIKSNERTEYQRSMNLASNENDYSAIINFYKMKICDSIIELDINDRLLKERNELAKENDVSSQKRS